MRLQLAKKMKINEAKAYVAEKLNVSVEELCDIVTMNDKREELGLGLAHVEPCAEANAGMEAKFRIQEILGIKVNSVEKFKERAGIK
ncbi:hypothetical protein M2140_000932 [Clostridiales Family XIII bacterium PM5-7]